MHLFGCWSRVLFILKYALIFTYSFLDLPVFGLTIEADENSSVVTLLFSIQVPPQTVLKRLLRKYILNTLIFVVVAVVVCWNGTFSHDLRQIFPSQGLRLCDTHVTPTREDRVSDFKECRKKSSRKEGKSKGFRR